MSDFVAVVWAINAFMLAFIIGSKLTEWAMRLWDYLRWKRWRKPAMTANVLHDVYLERAYIDCLRKYLREHKLGCKDESTRLW